MNTFERYFTRFAGVLLIIGPGLLVCAALLAAAGIGTTTGRWYDNQAEGMLMAAGFSLQLIGLLEACRRIGARRPWLGLLAAFTSVVGSMGSIFPAAVRIFAAVELELGFTVEQLDRIHGPSSDGRDPLMIVFPFILFFFLNYVLLLPLGLWRSKTGPRLSPLLLVVGTILFMIGQGSFEVGMLAYVSGVSAWFLALAPLGWELLRDPSAAKQAPVGAAAGD